MSRLLAILLIPLFVVGNSLAHSHGVAAQQSPGETRAHIHVGGGVHHDHDDHGSHGHSHHHDHHHHPHQAHHHLHDGESPDSTPVEPVEPVEHDSDAIYLVAADSLFTNSERGTLDRDIQLFDTTVACTITVANRPPRLVAPPFYGALEPPLYLLHAALLL